MGVCKKGSKRFVKIIIKHLTSFTTCKFTSDGVIQACIWENICSFYGLRFEPIWAKKVMFCKHMYHPRCTIVHFNTFPKCVDPLCAKVMHDSWWVYSGTKKTNV